MQNSISWTNISYQYGYNYNYKLQLANKLACNLEDILLINYHE